MIFTRTVSRMVAFLLFGGALLIPFMSSANDTIGYGSRPYAGASGQMHNDLEISYVTMDSSHMTGAALHSTNGYGPMAEMGGIYRRQ